MFVDRAAVRPAIGFLLVAFGLAACRGGAGGPGMLPSGAGMASGQEVSMSRHAPPMSLAKPASTSPGVIPPAPMAQTAILPPSDMTSKSPSGNHRMQPVSSSTWTLVPGGATQIVASPDGTLWALGTGTGDRPIWHYSGGSWTNIPGAASHLAVAFDGTLYATNAGGGIYSWNGSTWTAIAGGASAIAIGRDGTIYVTSNGGSGDRAIWKFSGGAWTQLSGSGVALSANWDPKPYTIPGGSVAPGGFFVINAEGYIYSATSSGTYTSMSGGASGIASTSIGGLFVIGYPVNDALGNQVYYWNLDNSAGGWSYQTGAGLSVGANINHVYVVATNNAIYTSTITGASRAAGPGTALAGPDYGDAGACSNNVDCGYAATDVATELAYPVQQGYDGRGETVAIVIDSDLAVGDLAGYETFNDTPTTGRTVTTESVDGGTGIVAAAQGEATLDEETIAGLAPGANIILYEIPALTDSNIDDALNQIESDGSAKIVSISLGGCENADSTASDAIFNSGVQTGITFVASSGDQGNECYNGTGYSPGVNYPASDPFVVGAGGNETYPTTDADELLNPVVWNDSNCGGPCGGGGGVSTTFTIPGYQQGLAGVSSTTDRNVPDISMPAEYTATYEKGAWGLESGTSWSAPEFAAMMAEIYEYCGTPIDDSVAMLYNVFHAKGYAAFTDVTSGNDQYSGAVPVYSAAAGYDNASGIGIPNGAAVANAACPSNQPADITMRAASALPRYDSQRPAIPLRVSTALRVQGLTDLGARSEIEETHIQIVLERNSTLASDEGSLVSALQSAGFTITRRFSNHLVVDAMAPNGTVERFFATQIHDVSQGSYGTRYMAVTSATVPAEIAPYVAGVVLNDVVTKTVPDAIVQSFR